MENRDIKVLFLTSVHPFDDTRIYYKEGLSLARNGYQVTLICPSNRPVNSDEIRIKTIKKETNRLKRIFFSTFKLFIKALQERADFYHFHDPELIAVGIMLKICTGSKVIYDVHEDNPGAVMERAWIPSTLRNVLSLFIDKAEKIVSVYFDAIITADDAVANRLKSDNAKVTILYNFPGSYFYTHDANHKLFQGLNNKLVYIGVISENRGLWLMLDTLKVLINDFNIQNIKLYLAGEIFNDNVQEEFNNIIMDPIFQDRVFWLGRVSQEVVIQLLDSSDIGWIPFLSIEKFKKNIPTKLFEYMARGLPIVGSDLPPIRKFVIDSNAGLLADPGDPKSHAREICSLIQNKEKANKLGKNGFDKVQEEYNWSRQELKLISLYKDLK